MKRTQASDRSHPSLASSASDSISVLNRLPLAFLDEYTCDRKGYDPYDTSRGRVPDVWRAKRKRA